MLTMPRRRSLEQKLGREETCSVHSKKKYHLQQGPFEANVSFWLFYTFPNMANKRPVTHFQTSRDLFILDTNEATACYYATSIGEIYRPTSLILKPKTWPTVQTLTTTFCPDYI